MRLREGLVLLTALVLASCGTSPKTHYFTLAAIPAEPQETTAIASPVTVAAVHVPPSLDRQELVRRTGANTVDISGQDRWSAPLGEMIRRVLSEELAARLAKGDVVPPESPSPPHTAQIAVSIVQFGPDGDNGVVLKGSWSLLEGGRETPVLRRAIALRMDSPAAGGSGQAAAMSQLLGQLATQIAESLARSAAAGGQDRGTGR
jgi:uncharacterized lipoprotein YmbA